MDIEDLIPHIEFKSILNTLELLKNYHLKASHNGSLREACPARLLFSTGRVFEGYIVDIKNEFNTIVMVDLNGVASDELRVSLLSASGIEAVEFDQFEKVYQLFSDNDLLEGIGEAPSILSLKKEFEHAKTLFNDSVFSATIFDIPFEDFRDNAIASWSLKELVQLLENFIEREDLDNDFKTAFVDSIDKINVVKADKKTLSVNDRTLQISLNVSRGKQGVPSSDELYTFLYDNL